MHVSCTTRRQAPLGIALAVSTLAAFALAAAPGAHAQNIVSDGGFENANFADATGGSYNVNGTSPGTDYAAFDAGNSLGDGWSVTQGIIVINDAATTSVYVVPVPQSGVYAAYLDNGFNNSNTLSQTLTTTPGQVYDISFSLADDGGNPVTVDFGSQTLLNGAGPTTYNGSPSSYQTYSFDATANSASTPLTFTGQYTDPSSTSYGTGLDNVSVTPLNTSVPEASSWTLLALGLLPLAGLRAARRRA